MRTYRISPSLLNAFSGWLNSDELYDKFWGNSEQPSMTMEEFERKQLTELLSYINREPQPPNEAADRGTCLNEIVDCLIGAMPNPKVWWDKIEGNYRAQLNGFEFVYDGQMVDDLAFEMRNGIPQYHLSHAYRLSEHHSVVLHGYADYIFPTMITDLKTTGKYVGEKYRDNWQRHVYPVIAVDSGDMVTCDAFVFHVQELNSAKGDPVLRGKIWKEFYSVNLDESRATVLEFCGSVVIPQLEAWREQGLINNQTIIRDE